MQVLGGILRLPEKMNSLPLPWWHRSVLGFKDNTPVYAVLLQTKKRPVGDLIVTVLEPSNWDRMKVLVGVQVDKPGVIEKVFEAVLPLNIAIAETATIESGNDHHICLFLEAVGEQDVGNSVLKQRLKSVGFQKIKLLPYMKGEDNIFWEDVYQVEHGWLHDIAWKQKIIDYYPDTYKSVDLNRCVVSADTERRILRYVFPMKGAFTIKIEHADIPGALKAMTECFVDCHLNVLSAILTRGGAKHKKAILQAVCEPVTEGDIDNLEGEVVKRIRQLPHWFQTDPIILHDVNASHTIYPHHPDEHVARVPNNLQPNVRDEQRKLPDKKIPIFISRRFQPGGRRTRIVERVKKTLEDNGCTPVEALPEPGQLITSLVQVSSKMWISKAGIVLLASGDGKALSMNIAHEAGFLQGQGKEVLFLAEEGCMREMVKWSNEIGVVAKCFSKDDSAFDPESPDSIDQQLTGWLEGIKEKNCND